MKAKYSIYPELKLNRNILRFPHTAASDFPQPQGSSLVIAANLKDPTDDGETNVIGSGGYPIKDAQGNTIRTIITSMDLKITLNKSILANASKEFITATIIHEAFHSQPGVSMQRRPKAQRPTSAPRSGSQLAM
jgi:hypothetical protein